MENEIWEDVIINNIKHPYQVSNIGRVKALPRTIVVWNRYQYADRRCKERMLTLCNDQDGYKIVGISNKTQKVHRLVAQAFLPNPDNLPVVNHKNGIKNDNRVENLEWSTIGDNTRHAYDTTLMKGPIGKKNANVKITKEIAIKIINLIKEGNMLDMDIAEKFNLNQSHISSIKNGKTWSRVTGVPYRGRMKIFQKKVINENNEVKE